MNHYRRTNSVAWTGFAFGLVSDHVMCRFSNGAEIYNSEIFPGSHSLVKGGMESVIRALEGGLSRTSILLNTEVTKCTESVHASRNEHAVTLETADGREFKCKFVVITISLGMLKTKARSWIAPPLPDDICDAIARLDMTCYTKLICAVSERAASAMPAWIALDHAIFSQAFNYFPAKKYLLCAFSPSILLLKLSCELKVAPPAVLPGSFLA